MSIRVPRARQPEAASRAVLHGKDDDAIDLVELFYLLLNRWYLIVACALIGALLCGGFAGLCIKRGPQYSTLGKLFSPVAHALANGRKSTRIDELKILDSTQGSVGLSSFDNR